MKTKPTKTKVIAFFLKLIAQLIIWRFEPLIIGVTGSAGKTSTKNAIAQILSPYKKVRASYENFNTELGFPLTILGDFSESELKIVSRNTKEGARQGAKLLFWLKAMLMGIFNLLLPRRFYPAVLVLEYGADHPGDIKYLLSIARPSLAVITAIGDIPVHVEFYPDIEAVVREKAQLIDAVHKEGIVILNADDGRVIKLADETKAKVLTFGFSPSANLRITNFETHFPAFGVSFKLEHAENVVPIRLTGSPGKAQAYAAAAAAGVGVGMNLNLVQIAESLSYFKLPKQRMNVFTGVNNSLIIDDSYNAAPLAMRHAIETVGELPAKRKIGILGDMRELGPYTLTAHQTMGKLAAGVFDKLIFVGENAVMMAQSAKKNKFLAKNLRSAKTAEEAIEIAKPLIKKGDLVLVKGSLSVGLKKVAEALHL